MVIAIVCPARDVVSETFIRAHIDCLPAEKLLIYGGSHELVLPRWHGDGQPLLAPAGLPTRALRRATRSLLRLPHDHFERQALARFLAARRVAVVLAEFGPSGVAMLDACQAAGVPLVAHFHGYDAYAGHILAGVGQHYPRLFSQAAAVVAVSRHMQRQLLGLGAPRDRLHLSPYGVDSALFQGAAPAQAEPLFVAAGRFVDKKAPYLTLLAFKDVAAEFPAARLVMIGDGPLREACQRLAHALGLAAQVEFPGALPHAAVAGHFRQARAFVQHSLTPSSGDSEGTPVSILEAGAAGLPVVATRHAGIVDVVVEGQTGLLVDEGDARGMAAHMLALARDPALAAGLGAAARRRIAAEYSLEGSISRLWDILRAAAGQPAA